MPPWATGLAAMTRGREESPPHKKPSAAHHKYRNIQFVANRVDGVAENQVLDAAVSMGAHDEEIGVNLAGVAHNLLPRIGAVADGGFNFNLHLAERVDEAVEILAARFDFSGGRFGAVDLAGDAFFHVQEINAAVGARREGRGVAEYPPLWREDRCPGDPLSRWYM